MISDDERREVAEMAKLNAAADAQFWKCNVARVMGLKGNESDAVMWHRLADLIGPDTRNCSEPTRKRVMEGKVIHADR